MTTGIDTSDHLGINFLDLQNKNPLDFFLSLQSFFTIQESEEEYFWVSEERMKNPQILQVTTNYKGQLVLDAKNGHISFSDKLSDTPDLSGNDILELLQKFCDQLKNTGYCKIFAKEYYMSNDIEFRCELRYEDGKIIRKEYFVTVLREIASNTNR